MIVVANRIFVTEGHEEAFEDRFRNRTHLVDHQPGFIRNEVLRPLRPELPYVVLTHWKDRDSFEAWIKSPEFRQAHQNLPPTEMFSRDNLFEIHEVVQTTDPA